MSLYYIYIYIYIYTYIYIHIYICIISIISITIIVTIVILIVIVDEAFVRDLGVGPIPAWVLSLNRALEASSYANSNNNN